MTKPITLLLGLTLSVCVLPAQDPAFSQFYINRIYLNPALVGLNNGTAFNASYRNQWPGVTGAFNTASVSAELQEPCLGSGFGLSVFFDQEGEAGFRTTAANLHYAYIIGFDRLGKSNLHFGMKFGYMQRSLNWSKLVFSDQLDPVYGNVRPTAAEVGLDRVGFPDFDAGIAWRQAFDHPRYRKTPIRTLLGLSVSHLLRPDQSFYDIESIVPRRWTIHAAAEFPMAPYSARRSGRHTYHKFFFMPNLKYEWQGESNPTYNQGRTQQLTYGMYVQTPSAFYLGLLLQHQYFRQNQNNTSALVVTTGLDFTDQSGYQYMIGGSYDFNIKGLSTRGGGAFEVNLRIVLTDARVLCNGTQRGRMKRETMRRIQDCNNFF